VTTAALPLQRAIYARLAGDEDLTALVGVYDEVPEGAAYPYVVLGDTVETPDEEHGRGGLVVMHTLHIWSKYRGFTEALNILGHVNRLLHRQPLTVAGFTDVSIAHDYSATLRDPDPQIRHVPARYRAWLTEE
jgi:hypothetical protein